MLNCSLLSTKLKRNQEKIHANCKGRIKKIEKREQTWLRVELVIAESQRRKSQSHTLRSSVSRSVGLSDSRSLGLSVSRSLGLRSPDGNLSLTLSDPQSLGLSVSQTLGLSVSRSLSLSISRSPVSSLQSPLQSPLLFFTFGFAVWSVWLIGCLPNWLIAFQVFILLKLWAG